MDLEEINSELHQIAKHIQEKIDYYKDTHMADVLEAIMNDIEDLHDEIAESL